jgi:hypothetical protein
MLAQAQVFAILPGPYPTPDPFNPDVPAPHEPYDPPFEPVIDPTPITPDPTPDFPVPGQDNPDPTPDFPDPIIPRRQERNEPD